MYEKLDSEFPNESNIFHLVISKNGRCMCRTISEGFLLWESLFLVMAS